MAHKYLHDNFTSYSKCNAKALFQGGICDHAWYVDGAWKVCKESVWFVELCRALVPPQDRDPAPPTLASSPRPPFMKRELVLNWKNKPNALTLNKCIAHYVNKIINTLSCIDRRTHEHISTCFQLLSVRKDCSLINMCTSQARPLQHMHKHKRNLRRHKLKYIYTPQARSLQAHAQEQTQIAQA